MPATREEIVGIIAEEARIDPARLRPDATLASLDIASLDVVSVLFAIEDKFGVDIPPEALADTETLGQFTDAILAKVATA